jgi:hypothetical protein
MTNQSFILSKKGLLLAISIIVVTAYLILFNMTVRKNCCADEHKTFTSPDGRFQIVVFRIQVFPMMMPGNSGDAPGFVRLYGKNRKILEEKDIEMVKLIEDVEWSKDKVYIKLFAEWDLPAG